MFEGTPQDVQAVSGKSEADTRSLYKAPALPRMAQGWRKALAMGRPKNMQT